MNTLNDKGALGPFFLSLNEIKPYLLDSSLKDSDYVKLIKEMSEKFTTKRDQIKDYVLDERHVSAYTALYLTTNIPKLHYLLNKLSIETLNDIFSRTFIDIGCGPGTYSLGMCLEKGSALKEIVCIDTSNVMLNQARKIIEGFYPEVSLKTQLSITDEREDSVLFFGHSINEMGVDQAYSLISKVNPEYVMWIEPGTSALFTELKSLRSKLLSDYDILYPCPSNEACPNDWCHQVVRVSHDNSVERLSQLVSLDRKILPMSAHIYRKKINASSSNKAVMTRFIQETKFSFEYEICFNHNGENKLKIAEIQKRNLSKKEEKEFKNLNVGELIDFEIEKEINEKIRIKIK